MRTGGLFVLATLLGLALTALPSLALAQPAPGNGGMVEQNPSDINSWGFAAVVPVGSTLTWTNTGGQSHTATASDGSFDTGLVPPGGSATVEFDTPGIFAYNCSPHPWMKGFVLVSDGAGPPPALSMVEGSPSDINSWGYAFTASAGDSINWTNTGSQGHSVTAADGSFDTGIVAPGASASLEFDTPGLYAFTCAPHPWMKGNILVN